MKAIIIGLLFISVSCKHESRQLYSEDTKDGVTVNPNQDSLEAQMQSYIQTGDTNSFKEELEKGTDPNLKLVNGNNLLHECVIWNQEQMAQILMDLNADPGLLNDKGKSAIDLASGKPIFLRILQEIDNSEINQRVFAACENGDHRELRTLIQEGAELNIVNEEGNNPLIVGVIANSQGIVHTLIRSTVDLSFRNNEGKTALAVAREIGNPRIISLLERAGVPE